MISAMAIGTIVVELLLAVGLWFDRTRLAAIVLGVSLHLAILMGIPNLAYELAPFALMSIATYMLFLGLDSDLPRIRHP